MTLVKYERCSDAASLLQRLSEANERTFVLFCCDRDDLCTFAAQKEQELLLNALASVNGIDKARNVQCAFVQSEKDCAKHLIWLSANYFENSELHVFNMLNMLYKDSALSVQSALRLVALLCSCRGVCSVSLWDKAPLDIQIPIFDSQCKAVDDRNSGIIQYHRLIFSLPLLPRNMLIDLLLIAGPIADCSLCC